MRCLEMILEYRNLLSHISSMRDDSPVPRLLSSPEFTLEGLHREPADR